MDKHFATLFEYVRKEKSLILLLSKTDPYIMKQSGFMDCEKKLKKLALEEIHRQKNNEGIYSFIFKGVVFSVWKIMAYSDLNNNPDL